jgi:hypothetical protein
MKTQGTAAMISTAAYQWWNSSILVGLKQNLESLGSKLQTAKYL